MRRLFKFIGSRFFLGAFCILLEFAQLLAVYILLYEFFLPVTILAWIFHFGVLLYLINRDEIPEFKMPWLIILFLLPVIGSFVYNGLAERFDRTKARLDEVGNAITEKQAKKEQIERFLAELKRQDGVATEFDEEQWYSLVDFVTVFNKEDIRFTFKDGTEIRA